MSKPKSPPSPSRQLGDAVADVKGLYEEYSHGKFNKAEIASKLGRSGMSATSGPFHARLFTLKEYGLLDQAGSQYSVSSTFQTLNTTEASDPKFKSTALAAIRRSDVFRELLDGFQGKLPSIDRIAQRLETEKQFNADRANKTATVLTESLRYAGVLDNANNILPIRGTSTDNGGGADPDPEDMDDNDIGGGGSPVALKVDVPIGEGRKVVVRYPEDLTEAEAKKVGTVLAAIVS
jgi:hypothetical protein